MGMDGRTDSHSDYSEDPRVVQIVAYQLSLVLCNAII